MKRELESLLERANELREIEGEKEILPIDLCARFEGLSRELPRFGFRPVGQSCKVVRGGSAAALMRQRIFGPVRSMCAESFVARAA
jgi:hypothetical protein